MHLLPGPLALPVPTLRHLLAHFVVVVGLCGHEVVGCCVSATGPWHLPRRGWEEGPLSNASLVLSIVESSVVLGILRACSAGCDASNVRRVSGIAVLPFDRLDRGVIQIHNQVLVDGVLIRRFRLGNRLSNLVINAPGLRAPVISRNPLVLRILIDAHSRLFDVRGPVLNGVIIN